MKIVLVGIGSSLACLGCGSGYSVIAMSSPSISQISPQVVAAGTPGVTLLVKGANFDGKSAIVLNGAAVPTSVVSSDTLSTQVAASVLAQPAVQQLQVQNSYGVTSNAVKLTVEANQKSANTQLAISTTSLQAGAVGSPYTATLAATGGASPYTWSVKTGSLPAGLSLSAAGVLSGMPTTAGNSTFTVQVKDSSTPGQTQTASLTLVVAAPVTTASPLATGSVVFGAGQVGVGYTATLTASGGTSPYAWWISAGSLPAGLTLSSDGVISGTPTAAGTSNFTFSVHDSGSPQQTLSKNASITVTPGNLAIVTSSLPSGTNGAPYNIALAATGGTPAYTWSVSSGKLPIGLTLSSNGVISGAPTQNGNVKFTVSVQDSGSPAQSQSASFSIHVG
ncbi:MAG TPA: putative Ig domain-containing protein, partial [Acidobacteriaceae bacterium]|nr:putative Ig domain-containing protein [Acidobacteriaceae bacterium]